MPKFFVNKNNISDHIVTLDGDNARHIAMVLRGKVGDEITVGDGEGRDYTCKLTEIDKKCVTAEITDIFTNDNEPKVKITLFQGLPKADKMELVIQKCIEIGVDSIVPVKTEHTVVKLDGKEEKKIARWNKIAESAAKQCGRGKIPVVENVMTFKQAVEKAKSLDMAIIPYEKEEKNTLKAVTREFKGTSIGIFIGPEGGFSNDEIALAGENGIQLLQRQVGNCRILLVDDDSHRIQTRIEAVDVVLLDRRRGQPDHIADRIILCRLASHRGAFQLDVEHILRLDTVHGGVCLGGGIDEFLHGG